MKNQEKSNKKTKSLLKEVKKEENGQIRRNKLEKLIRSLHQDQKDLIYSKEEDLRKRREDEVIKSLLEKNSKLRSRIENKQDREVQKIAKLIKIQNKRQRELARKMERKKDIEDKHSNILN